MLFRTTICVLFVLMTGPAVATPWTADKLNQLALAFAGQAATDYTVEQHGWSFFDAEACAVSDGICWGANPSSPYGYPMFVDSNGVPTNKWQMGARDALVIIAETPPPSAYFGFTHYLFSRSDADGEHTVYASLGETLNNLKIQTVQSAAGSSAPYSELSVIIMTADWSTFTDLRRQFIDIGFARRAVNLLAVPSRLPLNMGITPGADVFNLLLRVAVPENPSDLDDYIQRKPFKVFSASPGVPRVPVPIPTLGYSTPGSGAESPDLQAALDLLVEDIKANYSDYAALEHPLTRWAPVGHSCIENLTTCGGDNFDALYSQNVAPTAFTRTDDFILVAGVNHERQGKALYLNHTVSDFTRKLGIVSFVDKDTVGSAQFHAGVSDASDPRYQQYAGLYAYLIGYDCGGLPYCLEIPEPSATDPIGIPLGETFNVVGRIYVDPNTGVRPAAGEVIAERAFTLIRR